MKQNPVDKCSNLICPNRAEHGKFVILTVPEEGAHMLRPVTILLCAACAGSVQRYIEMIAEKMYDEKGPPPPF